MKKLYLIVLCICLGSIGLLANVVYVKSDAGGSNDGTSWENAFVSLTVALDSVAAGDSLWVAAGVYKPGTLRTDYFAMKKDVDLFGGFNGTETEFNQRDSDKNKVILSGDIGTEGLHTDNCKNVVVFPKGTGGTVTLDGFTIAFGYSEDVNWNERAYGAGVWVREGNSPMIVNCVFYMNRSKWGAAIGINAKWNNVSHPKIVSCSFINNYAWQNGGAIENQGDGNPVIANCRFIGNSAAKSGGAVYSYFDHGKIINSLFIGNWANVGGALHHDSYNKGNIFNSAFIGNYSKSSNAAVKSRGLTIRNSIVWGNTAQYFADSSMDAQITGIANSYNCIIQNCHDSVPGENTINADPLIFDYKGYDNIAGTLDDYPFILAGSSAIDAGDSTLLHKDAYDMDKDGNTAELIPYDLLNKIRIVGNNVDIGVFEGAFDPSNLLDLHVQAFPMNNAANIIWEPETMENVEAFKLYRSSVAGIWEFVADIDKQGRGYTLGSQQNGTVYQYKIVAVDAEGNEFGYNNTDAAVPRLEQGNAANFNGTKNYISIPDSLLFANESSISMWLKLSSASAADTMMIVSKQFSYALSAVKAEDGLYYLKTQTGDGIQWVDEVVGTKPLTLNKWMHIANTFNRETFEQQLFIDRELDTAYTGSLTNVMNSNLASVGAIKDTSGVYQYHFSGQIDELCFWNKTLTADDIVSFMDTPLKGNAVGVVALWHFDEHNNTYQKIAYDDGRGRINLRADFISFTESGAMVPEAPVADTLEFAMPGVKINWDFVEKDINEFSVYRYSSFDSEKVLVGSTSDTVFVNSMVVPAKGEFYYYVTSTDLGTNTSSASNQLTFVFDIPDAPLATASNLKNSVIVEWDTVAGGQPIIMYEVYRADTNFADSAKLIATVNHPVDSLIDENVVDSTMYYYWLKARAAYELVSDFSAYAPILYLENKQPVMLDTIPAIKVPYASLPLEIDLNPYFSDPDSVKLVYEVLFSGSSLATVDSGIVKITNLGNAKETVTVKVFDNWADSVLTTFALTPVYQTEVDTAICQGADYMGLTEAGDHLLELVTANSCDSLVTIHLSLNPVYETDEVIEICSGESYEGYTESGEYQRVLQSVSGCDSVVNTTLIVRPDYDISETVTICEGGDYMGKTEAGTYTFEYQSMYGCDSIVTVELAVNSFYEINEEVAICQGESYDGHTESGDYTKTLVSTIGCDSIVNLSLTVNQPVDTTEQVAICQGDSYEGFTEAGEYVRDLARVTGCDSTVTTALTVYPVFEIDETVMICPDGEYEGWDTAGNYQRILMTVDGCDSIVNTAIEIAPILSSALDTTISENTTIQFGDQTISAEGSYVDTLVSSYGCDSVVTLSVTVDNTPVSINKNSIGISVSPIPVVDECRIALTGSTAKQIAVVIRSIDGRLVMDKQYSVSNNVAVVDLASFASGLYLLTVTAEQQQASISLVKKD